MKLLIEILPQYINLLYLIFPWLWLWRALKSIFFWIHLWQLKEYHLGRFACHFQTHKGKSIFKRPLLWLKISALILAFYFSHFSFFIFLTLFFLYLVEGFVFFARILQRKLILPHLTFKAIFLILVNIIFFSFIAWYFAFDFKILVLWDIGDFSAISTLILIFQPISFFFRKRKINLAIQKRKLFKNLLAIGITGSFGKTSTKEFLSTILETKYGKDRVLKTPEHQNSEIAISNLLINELNLTHLFLVCEMGAYNKGGISLLAKMVKPKIGIVCGVNEQHLSLFGSLSNLLSAEGGKELLESLPEDGILIYNGEDQVLCKIYENLPKERKRIVGIEKKEFDLSAFNIKIEKTKLSFFALSRSDGEVAKFEVNLIGAQNIINLLLAACCAKELGIDLAESAVAFHNLKPQQGGIVFSKTPRLFNVLDASYSTNPNAVFAHLDHLRLWQGKKAILMPCLIELGKKSKEVHRKIGEKIAQICDLAIITTKDYFKEIKNQAKEKAIFCEDPEKIYHFLKFYRGQDDIILIEGRISDKIKSVLW